MGDRWACVMVPHEAQEACVFAPYRVLVVEVHLVDRMLEFIGATLTFPLLHRCFVFLG